MGFLSGGIKALGSYLNYKATDSGYSKGIDAARFRPFNISNGFGSASFSNQNADGRLSPEYQQMKDKMLSMSSGLLNFDPNQTSQNALGLLRGLAQPEENRQYYDLESRLFSQGTLGAGDATGSNPSMRAYFDSRNQADLSRQLQSIGLGESMMNNRITQSRGLLTSSEDLDQKIMDMIKLGIMGGQARQSSDQKIADLQVKRGENRGDFWTSMANSASEAAQSFGW
jgi:hypothetical protein